MNLPRMPFALFCRTLLRGSGQVVFMENALTGVLNFVALAWAAAFGAASWWLVGGAFTGLFISTVLAWALVRDRAALHAGLYGFNGLLIGAVVALFVLPSPAMWALLVLATGLGVVATLALQQVLLPLRLAGLTAPFVLTGWLVLLGTSQWPAITLQGLPAPGLLLQATPAAGVALGWEQWVRAAFTGVAQVFFVDNAAAGAILVLALAVHSRWCALLALLGSLVGAAMGQALGANAVQVVHGLWGYSAVLTAPALGCVFLRPAPVVLVWTLLGTLVTVIVQGAAFSVLGTLGIPAFTAPFVATTWLFLLAWHGMRLRSA